MLFVLQVVLILFIMMYKSKYKVDLDKISLILLFGYVMTSVILNNIVESASYGHHLYYIDSNDMDKLREFIKFFNPKSLDEIPTDKKKMIGSGNNTIVVLGDIKTDKVIHNTKVNSDRVLTNTICSKIDPGNCSSSGGNYSTALNINEGQTDSNIVFGTHVTITNDGTEEKTYVRGKLHVNKIGTFGSKRFVEIKSCCTNFKNLQNGCNTNFCK